MTPLPNRVITAGTKRDALSALDSIPLALVISDWRLPDGDSLEIIQAAQRRRPAIPTLVVTGYPSETLRGVALNAGAAEVLPKPFDVAELMKTVSRLVGRP